MFKGIYDFQILVNVTYLLKRLWRMFRRPFLVDGWQHNLSTVLGNISVHKDTLSWNMTLDHMIPPSRHCFWFLGLFSTVFLQVWWLSSLSLFWILFCTKGLLELNTYCQPKVSVLFCFIHQLNVITDLTALISIWYLIGRFASSIWRCCSNYFKILVFSFNSFFLLEVQSFSGRLFLRKSQFVKRFTCAFVSSGNLAVNVHVVVFML